MLTRLATFLHAHGRRVLIGAVICTVDRRRLRRGRLEAPVAVQRGGPGKREVRAGNRFEASTGRQIDPGSWRSCAGERSARRPRRRRVDQVAAELRAQPDVAQRAVSYYDTHDPAMASRDRRSTYVVAYFKPLSDQELKDVAQRIENQFAGQRDVRLGGDAIANAQANTQVGA